MELMEIMEEELWTALKRTKGRVPGIDVCAEMMIASGEVGISWMKRLLYVCMYVRGFNSGGLDDSVDCADIEGEARCSRSEEVQGHYAPK